VKASHAQDGEVTPVEFRDQTLSSDLRCILGGLLARDIDRQLRSDPMVLKCECIEKRSILPPFQPGPCGSSAIRVQSSCNARVNLKTPQSIDIFSPDVDQVPGRRSMKATCETPVNAGRPCSAAEASEKTLS
jgi:hypothetical protein